MGYLFESPPKRSKRRWMVVQVLAEYGIRFNKAASSVFLVHFITGGKSLPANAVRRRIEEMIDAGFIRRTHCEKKG